MLDKHSLEIMKWFKENQENSYSIKEINKMGLSVEFPTLDWLSRHDYLTHWQSDEFFDAEYENPPYYFKISPGGLTKIEEHRNGILTEVRAWVTAAIAVAAFVLSVIALALGNSH